MADSLKLASGARFLASAQALAPILFKPEDVRLDDYVFVPYVRTGLAAAITAEREGNRAVVPAAVEVADSANPASGRAVTRKLTLYGPGDVTGIDRDQIIRREPAANTSNSEQGYLAHVEFGRPDFPWMFTPLPANPAENRCDPWLALIVCESALSRLVPSRGELPAQIWTKKGQLQSLIENHRFAHAQVVGAAIEGSGPKLRGPAADTVETRLTDEHGPANLSRILCPRRLDDGVRYIAALVPAFDCGVQAGLGLGGGTLNPAWTRTAGDEQDDIVLPVYDSWEFSTQPGGSFRELAERIKPRAAPWAIGRRMIDLSRPGSGIPDLPDGDPAGVQVLECALYSPAGMPADQPVRQPWPVAHRDALRQRVDQANDVSDADLPRVGARLYARYQRAANRLGAVFGDAPFGAHAAAEADAHWFTQLNTDPMMRIVAALGAKVVQKDQEQLMQAAWAQVEGIRRANMAVIWAGMAERVNISIRDRHLAPLDPGPLMQVTRNVHVRIRDTARPRSVHAAIIESRTAATTLGTAFRRALRAGGPIGLRLAGGVRDKIVAGPQGFADHRRLYSLPDGIRDLSKPGLEVLSPVAVGRVLGLAPDLAIRKLSEQVGVLARSGGALSQLTRRDWTGPAAGKMGDIIIGDMLDRLGDRIKLAETGRGLQAERLAEVLVGVSNSGGGVAARAKTDLGRVVKSVPAVDLPGRVLSGSTLSGGSTSLSGSLNIPGRVSGSGGIVHNRPLSGGLGSTIYTVPGAAGTIGRGTTIPGPVLVDRPAAAATAIPTEPAKRFETDLSRWVAGAVTDLNAVPVARLRANLSDMVRGQIAVAAIQTDLGPLTVSKPGLLAQINPIVTAKAAFKGRLSIASPLIRADWVDIFGLRPIMAAPVFNRAMSGALEDYDRDWLVPGLGSIADRDFVTLLSINPGFAEAFLIGASDEMGRELLWRDYPTDQRGTYFKRFWDSDEDELTRPIHRFAKAPVGRHFSIGGGGRPAGAGALALVVRGELLRRFPDTVIMAMRATSDAAQPSFTDNASDMAAILFHTHLDPDYTVVGFDLSVEQITSPSQHWWFLMVQNPTAPRFGLDADKGGATGKNDLDWGDFSATPIPPGGFLPVSRSFPVKDDFSTPATVTWPGHAGTTARILQMNPIRAAFRARRLIEDIQE